MPTTKFASRAAPTTLPVILGVASSPARGRSEDDLSNHDHGCEVLRHSDFDTSFRGYQ